MALSESISSDSDDDLYTKSIDLEKVKVTPHNDILPSNSTKQESRQIGSSVAEIEVIDDDASLDLPDTEQISQRAKEARKKRIEQLARKELLELEKIISEPALGFIAPYPKRTKRVNCSKDTQEIGSGNHGIASYFKEAPVAAPDKSTDVYDLAELDKEVNLYVTVFVDKDVNRKGRFMTLLRDEPFDKLRPEFARELKCNQLDVMIHVNNVDAGPGDTPDSMGLDIDKLAVVNVFSLRSEEGVGTDFSTDPSFIPVKCIFASGRPRCVYIKLTETFEEAKKRIKEALHLPGTIEKLVFDNDVLEESETPESTEMEAEDVLEVYLKTS
ncbi:unnamed protein product [Cylicocyclus nassatus]|uniref:Ubiquitin-like domain-containing protein n=1 Tax=Cylicocyclus nassatus TaxID=53992 RepID=A0AA36GM22_CYLNA|nr:unnamed protein product [Cylicocyclus nassatus]